MQVPAIGRLGLAMVAACVLLIIATQAAAADRPATWDDYAERVTEARVAAYEAKDDLLDSREASDLAAQLNTLIPARESVAMGEEQTVVVDNSVYRAMVTELDTSSTPSERGDAVDDIVAYLDSLHVAVGEPRDAGVPSDPELLDELLGARRAETSQIEEYIQELLERLGAWLEELLAGTEGSGAGVVLDWVVRGVIILLALGLLYVALRVVQRIRRSAARRDMRLSQSAVAPVVAAAEGLPDDALGHADELARQERYREAVRALYGGAARTLVDTGVVKQTRTLTSAELLTFADSEAPEVGAHLAHLTTVFESAWYGHRDPGQAGFDQAREDHLRVVAAVRERATGGEAA
jgi:hypothetical protein